MCPFDEGAEYPGSNTVASRLVGFIFWGVGNSFERV